MGVLSQGICDLADAKSQCSRTCSLCKLRVACSSQEHLSLGGNSKGCSFPRKQKVRGFPALLSTWSWSGVLTAELV